MRRGCWRDNVLREYNISFRRGHLFDVLSVLFQVENAKQTKSSEREVMLWEMCRVYLLRGVQNFRRWKERERVEFASSRFGWGILNSALDRVNLWLELGLCSGEFRIMNRCLFWLERSFRKFDWLAENFNCQGWGARTVRWMLEWATFRRAKSQSITWWASASFRPIF